MTKTKKTIAFISFFLISIIFVISNSFGGQQRIAYAETQSETITADDYSGIGLGINIITAEKFNDYKLAYNILDPSAREELLISTVTLNESFSSTYSTTKVENLLCNLNNSFGIGVGADVFVASVELGLGANASFNYENYQYKYYYAFEHNINREMVYINNYLQNDTYANAFSGMFLSDLELLKNGTITYDNFFEKYGTHLIGSAIFGGKLCSIYSVVSNKVVLNEEMKDYIDTAISANGINNSATANVVAGINSYFGVTNKYTTNDVNTAFAMSAYGGSVVASNNIANFNTSYVDWCNSFESSNNSVLIDYASESLVPIWDILPNEYSNLSLEMENRFLELHSNAQDNLIEIFKTGNYIDFDGGTGVASDPFLISEPEQMLNIETTDMSADYKLINDINLSGYAQWNAIGGHYKLSGETNAFTGVFDGNGKTISHLTRTNEITPSNNRSYFGLFGWIGESGVVKNLVFTNININIHGPLGGSAAYRLFFGVVAGACEGTVQNVETFSGTFIYDCCEVGMSYVGAIAGIADNANFNNCTNNININSGRYGGVVGGITGYANGTNFISCTNNGNLTATSTGWGGYANSGGISGEIFNKTSHSKYKVNNFYQCINNGKLYTKKYGNFGFPHYPATGQMYAFLNQNYLHEGD